MPGVRMLAYGPDAVLVEVDDIRLVLPLAEALRAEPASADVVPGACTVLVRAHGAVSAELRDRIRSVAATVTPADPAAGRAPVELPVTYDGADLDATADALGIGVDELITAHSEAVYVVAFCGFAPGFAYLRGLPERLRIARLREPRTRVPAGSVGIAGEFTGVYPRESPGGWRLLGRTDAQLWSVDADPPALLAPGTTVRFVPT